MSHPSFESLLDYVEDKLSATAREEVEKHLSQSCRECDRQIARLRKLLSAINRDETNEPPVAVLHKAFALYEQNLNRSRPSVIQTLAKLLFDSRQEMSAGMVRGTTQLRRVLYSTQQVDIDLQITPVQGLHNLIGQVMDSAQPDEFTPAFVSVKNILTGELMEGKETDSLGQFNFQKIPSGQYDLFFELDSQEVTIRNLELTDEF